ncbi:hypothetical protein ACWD6I_10195 [Streptomyces sp. NPDC002454]
MNDLSPAPHLTEDLLFGEIAVRIEGQERVTVSGANIPTAVLERDPSCEVDPQIAIGTRDAAHLTLTLDGAPVALRPGKGRFRRSTYRVRTSHQGVTHVLVPDSIPSSRFTRDKVHLADFSNDGDEIVIVEWREGASPEPVDAALGYLLAAAFGTGGSPAWMMLVDAVSAALP